MGCRRLLLTHYFHRIGGGLAVALALLTAPEGATASGAYDRTGEASWYGARYQGRVTASGALFDMNGLTAAHRRLPFGTLVRVTNLDNQRAVFVRITDRGPYARGRLIDLSRRAAELLGFAELGVARVRVQVEREAERQMKPRLPARFWPVLLRPPPAFTPYDESVTTTRLD
jgi:rare lipoprotein A